MLASFRRKFHFSNTLLLPHVEVLQLKLVDVLGRLKVHFSFALLHSKGIFGDFEDTLHFTVISRLFDFVLQNI